MIDILECWAWLSHIGCKQPGFDFKHILFLWSKLFCYIINKCILTVPVSQQTIYSCIYLWGLVNHYRSSPTKWYVRKWMQTGVSNECPSPGAYPTLYIKLVKLIVKLRQPIQVSPSRASYSYGRGEKETHELIFSWLSWQVVLFVGLSAKWRRRSHTTWRPYCN